MTMLHQRSRLEGRRVLVSLAILAIGLEFGTAGLARADADPAPAGKVTIRAGDHICLIGNTLPDRMQHDGWLETLFQSRFPRHQLVFRNLGFSGDELTLRLRSEGFGSPDDWLTFHKTDVVLAFFGYNESFAGPEGLEKFRTDLKEFIKHTLGQQYNGKSAPRLVLFSPIAHEDLHDRNLPDGRANNARLRLYSTAMAGIARVNGIPFVDLFHASQDLYARAARPLTINGIHLTEHGNRLIAEAIDKVLFAGEPAPARDAAALEKLRQAVIDKDFYWFQRYRTLDGYNVYGGRSWEKYTDGQTNRVVMQREMEVLDVMTANRDKRVWAVAQGGDLQVDDSNTPPFIPTKTNKPGPGPGGTHLFLDGEEAIGKMTVAQGMKVNLFASEKEFPELAKPVQMQFDTRGRLWVAVWPSYPHWKPKEEMNDKILILEDTRGTGKADKCTVFADHLNCPTGFEFYNGGVLVAQAPDILFLKDTKGDGKADLRVRVVSGIDSADTHHTSNSFTLDPGGAIYFQEGIFHRTQVESPYGPCVRCADAGVFRYEPRAQKFEVYANYPFLNPHGHAWDRWGEDIVFDGTTAQPFPGAVISGHLDYPAKHPPAPQVYQQRTRPCPGVEILSSRHFPEANQGNLLVGNVIGFQGILQYKLQPNGSSLGGTEVEPIVYSSDTNFRPSDIRMGADGAIYFLDWQNPIIGHLQHHIRDPNRDRTHGRIYRVTYEGRPLLKSPKIAGESIARLLDLLKEPEDRVRYRTRVELSGRDSNQVVAAVGKWVAGLEEKDPQYAHNLLEALWVHQQHNVVNVDLLGRVLASPDFRARAAATRVLGAWHDRVSSSLERLKKLAADPHPRVRLQAVRAASFYTVPEAVEVPLIATEQPGDVYLDYVRRETMRALEPYWKKAIAQGHRIPVTSAAGAHFLLSRLSTAELLKMERDRPVYLELLIRKDVRDEYRQEALAGLARLEKQTASRVLLDAIHSQEQQSGNIDESVVHDLARMLTGRSATELAAVRPELEKMATGARLPVTRQVGFVALMAADGTTDKAWELTTHSVPALRDLVSALPFTDPNLRVSLYPKVEALLHGLPRALASQGQEPKGTLGRYVRVELSGRRTLTLAEVEVYSGGRNVARAGKASQKNTAYGGVASRAIDGNTSGKYGAGGQSHTQINTLDPWWEVDLGSEVPIDSVVIYNRTDDDAGKRLEGFTLRILGNDRTEVFAKQDLPAPDVKVQLEVGGGRPETMIRRAAMNALPAVRGQETQTFKALVPFVREGPDRDAALAAILRIPSSYWPPEEARPILQSLLAYLRKVPARDRTSPVAVDAIQFGYGLTALLPLEEARQVRRELGELGVRVLRIGTLPDQMLFDKERLAVQAGKPVEIVFENHDLMPHNFVVTQPGALEQIGQLAEATATQPGALERHYVPASDKILLASRLLQHNQMQKLSLTAPQKPGVYPFVCTYPGHWRRMYGALYVVADLEQYLADPEGYVTRNPLPAADELLKFTRPRKEWKLEDLASSVEQMEQGRSFSNGKQMFTVANCLACHRLGGVGNAIGPDLTKLEPKLQKPIEILHDILDPSFRINEKYVSYTFETKAGKLITGLILEETPEVVKVIENPLAKTEPVVLKRSEIESRQKSPTSIMPKGLLDRLTREEILDLVAYVAAGGDARHKLFKGEHQHGQGHQH
jgi:putative heme-binding domain-containing protein